MASACLTQHLLDVKSERSLSPPWKELGLEDLLQTQL